MANPYGVPKGRRCIGWIHPKGNFTITDYCKDPDTGLAKVKISCRVGGLGCVGSTGKWIRKTDIHPDGTNSCGCLKKEGLSNRQTTHGDSSKCSRYSKLYETWRNMRSRCKPGFEQAKDYYEKGVKVCDDWQEYSAFKAWAISQGWKPGLSPERVKNDKGYEPSNCKLIPFREQGGNTSRVTYLEAFGEQKSLSLWAADSRCQVSYNTLCARINQYGWEAEKAIATSSRNQGSRLSDEQRLRNILSSAIARCTNKEDRQYKNYGARGIFVCEEWMADRAEFVSWALAHGYRRGLTLERDNNEMGYEPANCYWATRGQQAGNRRNSIRLTIGGIEKTVAEWASDPSHPMDVTENIIRRRVRNGWPDKQAVMHPKGLRRESDVDASGPQLEPGW